ncbi:MAG: hypothetical protein ABIS86_15170 [Streptosporangiaceae bacterium]
MKRILCLVFASVAVLGTAGPVLAGSAAKYEAHTDVSWYRDEGFQGINVWVYRVDSYGDRARLRFIKVCLQRDDGDGFANRSCKKTDEDGNVSWLLYPDYDYRIFVPATAYHYEGYSDSFYSGS